MFFEDFLNFLSAWYRSRRWRATLWLMAASAILPLLACILILVGLLRSRGDMLTEYMQLVTNQLDMEVSATGGQGVADSQAEELETPELSPEELQEAREQVQVPLRRMMQLGSANERVVYAVASQLLRQGRVGMATRLLRDIAPEGGQGFAAAHAWLVRLGQLRLRADGRQSGMDEAMKNDLAVAEAGGALQPAEISAYANYLDQQERTGEALRLLRRHASLNPHLNQLRAKLAKKAGDEREFRDAAESYRRYLEKRLQEQPAVEDFTGAVLLSQLEGDYEAALQNTARGQQAFPETDIFRRLRADVLVEMYSKRRAASPEDDLAGLELLNQAIALDPTNFEAMQAVAGFVGGGKRLPADMIQRLEQAVVDGTGSALAHQMLANVKLMDGDAQAALPHLRLALQSSQPNAIVLNNLAVAILEAEPDNLAEAKQYAEQALRLGNNSPQIYASIYDTLGQIYVLEGETLTAIASFERAIQADKTKINTRRRLANAYRQAGMEDLAALQLARVKQLEGE